LGKIQAPESRNIYVKFYQSDEFEHITTISVAIVNQFDSLIVGPVMLTGTDAYEKNVKRFKVREYKNILYITYVDNQVIGAYDIVKKNGFPFGTKSIQEEYIAQDSIIKILKTINPDLYVR
jgi:hypothetical protein